MLNAIGVKRMDEHAKGVRLLQEGRYDDAAKQFEEAIEENPDDPMPYLHFGDLLAATGDAENALNIYKQALELDDALATAYYGAGNAYYKLALYDEAKKMF